MNIAELFYCGRYRELLALSLDKETPKFSPKELPFVVGALAFLGRLEEAEVLWKSNNKQSQEVLYACRFFLGIAFCRHSFYEKSRELLCANLIAGRRERNPHLRFYAWQGLGFYRFFCGRFSLALKSARLANQSALEVNFLWGRLVASDLIGHSLIQTGEIFQGLEQLKQAQSFAESLQDGGIRQALEVSQACYRAQYGQAKDPIKELRRIKLGDEDTYSHAALLLELGRQSYLRGRWKESQDFLNQSCRFVYGSRNRRQGVILNLRYAMLHYLAGDGEQALNLLLNASRELVPKIDNLLELELLGLQVKILQSLGIVNALPSLRERIRFLTFYTGHAMAERILERENNSVSLSRKSGQDKIAEILDQRENTEILIESGYFLFLLDRLNIKPVQSMLLLDLLPGSILAIARGQIYYSPKGLSATIRKILQALASGQDLSKEKLIEKVWGYRYRPLEHDPLIYSTFSRLRQSLGPFSHWIEVTERGYRLHSAVTMRLMKNTVARQQPELVPELIIEQSLNMRQLKILRYLQAHEFIDLNQCKKMFRVSTISSSRDLSELYKKGLVARLGKARATVYKLA